MTVTRIIVCLVILFSSLSADVEAAPKGKNLPKDPDRMTLDDWESVDDEAQQARRGKSKEATKNPKRRSRDVEMRDIVADEADHDRSAKTRSFSMTEIFFGPGVTMGSWSAQRTNSTVLQAGIGQLLVPDPVYVSLNIMTFASPATPRNFMLSANLGAGFIAAKTRAAPFIGFRVGAARLVVSGRGRGFGATMGPEVGFFPFHIKGKPISVRGQYNWITDRLDNTQPRWLALLLGVAL